MHDPNVYDPNVGFNLFFDFLCRLIRQFRQARLVYAVYSGTRSVIPPAMVEAQDAEPDPENKEMNRVMLKVLHTLRQVQPHPSANLVFEIQVPKPGEPDRFVSFGWTILNLFDSFYDLNRGIFKLPLYASPTRTDLDVRDIPSL